MWSTITRQNSFWPRWNSTVGAFSLCLLLDNDTEEEVELKKKILDIYNKRLDERNKRKDFVVQRGLLDIRKQNQLDRLRTKDEREIYNMLKPFARFHSEEEHEKLVKNIVKERNIRKRIEELMAYKKLGLTTFSEIEVVQST